MGGPATRRRSGRGRGWRSGLAALAASTLAIGSLAACGGGDESSGDDSQTDSQADDLYEGLDDIDGSTLVTPFADVALRLYDEAGTSRTDDPATGIGTPSCPLVDDDAAATITAALGVDETVGVSVTGVSLKGTPESELLTCVIVMESGPEVALTIGTTLLDRVSLVEDVQARDPRVDEVEGEVAGLDDEDVIGVEDGSGGTVTAFWINGGFQMSLSTSSNVSDVDGAFRALPALVDAVYTAFGRPESPAG